MSLLTRFTGRDAMPVDPGAVCQFKHSARHPYRFVRQISKKDRVQVGRFAKILMTVLLYTMIFVNLAATNPSLPQIVMKLSPIWKFAADPNDQGITKLWYADDFDDSSWKTLQSG